MNDNDQPIRFAPLAPRRDLWPGIEARVTRRRPWKGVAAGIAASLVIIPLAMMVGGRDAPKPGIADSAAAMQSAHEQQLARYQGTPGDSGMQAALEELDVAERAVLAALEENPGKEALLGMLAHIHSKRLGVLMKAVKVKEYT